MALVVVAVVAVGAAVLWVVLVAAARLLPAPLVPVALRVVRLLPQLLVKLDRLHRADRQDVAQLLPRQQPEVAAAVPLLLVHGQVRSEILRRR